MYRVKVDGKTIYYPGNKAYTLTSGIINETLGETAEFTFSIPKTNPLYDSLYERITNVIVEKTNTVAGTLVWDEKFCGEIREITTNLKNEKQIYCLGELAYLANSIQRQARYQDVTPYEFFSTLIEKHNEQVVDKHQFKVGYVLVEDSNDSVYHYTNYEDTLSAIREKMCDTLNGFIKVRKSNGVRYLDLLPIETYGKKSNQSIEFGKNLLDYTRNINSADIATVCIPLGKKLEEQQKVEGLDAYTTIDVCPATNKDGIQHDSKTDYVYSVDAVAAYGKIVQTVEFENVSYPINLMNKGIAWLKNQQFANAIIDLNAVDLADLGVDVDEFSIGDYVRVRAKSYNMDVELPIMEKATDILDVKNSKVTISNVTPANFPKITNLK